MNKIERGKAAPQTGSPCRTPALPLRDIGRTSRRSRFISSRPVGGSHTLGTRARSSSTGRSAFRPRRSRLARRWPCSTRGAFSHRTRQFASDGRPGQNRPTGPSEAACDPGSCRLTHQRVRNRDRRRNLPLLRSLLPRKRRPARNLRPRERRLLLRPYPRRPPDRLMRKFKAERRLLPLPPRDLYSRPQFPLLHGSAAGSPPSPCRRPVRSPACWARASPKSSEIPSSTPPQTNCLRNMIHSRFC